MARRGDDREDSLVGPPTVTGFVSQHGAEVRPPPSHPNASSRGPGGGVVGSCLRYVPSPRRTLWPTVGWLASRVSAVSKRRRVAVDANLEPSQCSVGDVWYCLPGLVSVCSARLCLRAQAHVAGLRAPQHMVACACMHLRTRVRDTRACGALCLFLVLVCRKLFAVAVVSGCGLAATMLVATGPCCFGDDFAGVRTRRILLVLRAAFRAASGARVQWRSPDGTGGLAAV